MWGYAVVGTRRWPLRFPCVSAAATSMPPELPLGLGSGNEQVWQLSSALWERGARLISNGQQRVSEQPWPHNRASREAAKVGGTSVVQEAASGAAAPCLSLLSTRAGEPGFLRLGLTSALYSALPCF